MKRRNAKAKSSLPRDGPTRLTRQRRLVLEVVRASADHPTAAQVYERVRRRDPRIAFSTIYNTLRWWEARGQLLGFTFGDAATRYDRRRERHDHAIWTGCGRLMDTVVHLPRSTLARVHRQTGLRVTSHHVQFLGICPNCACLRRQA